MLQLNLFKNTEAQQLRALLAQTIADHKAEMAKKDAQIAMLNKKCFAMNSVRAHVQRQLLHYTSAQS